MDLSHTEAQILCGGGSSPLHHFLVGQSPLRISGCLVLLPRTQPSVPPVLLLGRPLCDSDHSQ